MKKTYRAARDMLIAVLIPCISFGLCLIIQHVFKTSALIPAIFVLGSFVTSVLTDGYIYGTVSALLSVLAVNFAFTFPFFRINFLIPENLISAIIMIIVALVTCALTTKLKRQEVIKAEGEKERTRANLLRAVSHDLRTPLTTIYGASSALLENESNFTAEQKVKMLSGIRQDAEWLSRMVENLLSITRLDNGNVKIIKTPTVLDELVDSVLIKFNKRYPEQEVLVDIPDEFIVIPMDAILIEQVAINILENAVRHASGMTSLSLKVYTAADKAVFKIADNGCGIDPEKRKMLFVGCYSAEKDLSDRAKNNAGIGLSVCATIIKAHGGEIKAECPKSGGSVFTFTLGMEECENE